MNAMIRGEGEDEDQIEEDLERGDPVRIIGRRRRQAREPPHRRPLLPDRAGPARHA